MSVVWFWLLMVVAFFVLMCLLGAKSRALKDQREHIQLIEPDAGEVMPRFEVLLKQRTAKGPELLVLHTNDINIEALCRLEGGLWEIGPLQGPDATAYTLQFRVVR